VNAEELYQAMKEALEAFGLKWNEKEKMKVTIISTLKVSFEYNGRAWGYHLQAEDVLQRERMEAFHAGYQSNKECVHEFQRWGADTSNVRCKKCGKLSRRLVV
jgi:hypothetical protein